MKKLTTLFLLTVLASGATFAEDAEYAITVPATTSTVILPPRSPGKNYTGLWATNAVVTNGEILRVLSTKEDYLVLVGGTTSATNYPSNVTGQVEVSGTVTAIHCNYKQPREKAYVTLESDVKVWFHTGTTATTNGGEYARYDSQQYTIDENTPVSVYAESELKLNIKDK